MAHRVRTGLALAAFVMAAGAGAHAQAAGDAAKGKTVFFRCISCHSVKPGQKTLGPNLAGVVGRKAGQDPGYAYSAVLKAGKIVWNEKTLDAYLTKPASVAPGGKMIFAGLPKDTDRADVIAYLKSPQ